MPRNLRFAPVGNGIDYLLSVVSHLGKGAQLEDTDLKYGVLHLHAATEVLLKARLSQEHWSQVLEDPAAARLEKFRSGEFKSCSLETAIERLDRVAGIQIGDNSRSAIRSLTMLRNSLQHYGLEHSAEAIEASAASVLNFLITFLDEHLLPDLHESEWDVDADVDRVRDGLADIQGFVRKRMNEIKNALARQPEFTIQCTTCQKQACIIGRPEARCLFCTQRMDSDNAAIGHVHVTLQRPFRQIPTTSDIFSQPAQPAVDRCQNCGQRAWVVGAVTTAEPTGIDLCFHCAQTSAGSTPKH